MHTRDEPCYLSTKDILARRESSAVSINSETFFYHMLFLHFLLEDEEPKFLISASGNSLQM